MTVSIISLPAGKEFFIKKNIITLGRDKNNDVAIIKNSFVSRKHCQINFRDNKYFVEDLNSQNGTYVNGELIEAPVELKNNDTITLSVKGPIFQFKTYSESEKDSNNSSSKIKIILKKILKNTEIKNNLLFRLIGILIIFIIITSLFFFRTKIYLSLIDDEVKKEFIRVMLKYGEKNFPTNGEFIEKIRNYINVYKNSKDFREGLKRRKNYIKMIEKIFKKHKIPVDLSY
ncbi:MAG: FHA domain-containing protein, partial [Spirochaetes bacterium]|nr:FHA domain-containing protein [Spirochaetota bacterium]